MKICMSSTMNQLHKLKNQLRTSLICHSLLRYNCPIESNCVRCTHMKFIYFLLILILLIISHHFRNVHIYWPTCNKLLIMLFLWIFNYIQKISFILYIAYQIFHFKEICVLIGLEFIQPQLKKLMFLSINVYPQRDIFRIFTVFTMLLATEEEVCIL